MKASMIPKARTIFLYAQPVFWGIVLVLFLNSTSPLRVGPAGTLAVFVILYLFACSLLYVLARLVLKIWQLFNKKKVYSKKRTYYLTSIIALAPVFFIALNTLGQLGFAEVFLVILLVAVACFYVVRRSNA